MSVLFKKKTIAIPTIYGWVLCVILIILLGWIALKITYPFLSHPKKSFGKVLVVEGWIPDQGIKNALKYYQANGYSSLFVTGVPITQWTYSSPFANMAEATAETMRRNFFKDTIYLASIPTNIVINRTYATAISLKLESEKHGIDLSAFDLYSMGAHSRRSHLMFTKAFPSSYIGLIVDTDPSFEPAKWYQTSRGFRTVFGELISYVYSRIFFWPDEQTTIQTIITGKYIDRTTQERLDKDRFFADSTSSPLNPDELPYFEGLSYFDTDPKWKFRCEIEIDTTEAPFEMPTTTARLPLYRKYGLLKFNINDSTYTLSAYQNMEFLAKDPTYKNLFIPFKDLTNTHETYGGGRYMDIEIPDNDSVILDFNLAYNPYCAYDDKWSCPLPPFENYLKLRVEAGEMMYKTP